VKQLDILDPCVLCKYAQSNLTIQLYNLQKSEISDAVIGCDQTSYCDVADVSCQGVVVNVNTLGRLLTFQGD
jgi:hypothetical protein